jgi:hypothetical protein
MRFRARHACHARDLELRIRRHLGRIVEAVADCHLKSVDTPCIDDSTTVVPVSTRDCVVDSEADRNGDPDTNVLHGRYCVPGDCVPGTEYADEGAPSKCVSLVSVETSEA